MNDLPLGIQLYVLAMYEVEFVERECKKYKLDKHQFLYLCIPSVFPGIVQSVVAQYFNVNKSTAGRMIIKLVDKGYLRREKGVNDRDYNIYLTSEGEVLRDKIVESVKHYEDVMMKDIEDKAQFKKVFRTIFDTVRTTRKGKKLKGREKVWETLATQ